MRNVRNVTQLNTLYSQQRELTAPCSWRLSVRCCRLLMPSWCELRKWATAVVTASEYAVPRTLPATHAGGLPRPTMLWCQWVRVAKSKSRVGESYLAILWGTQTSTSLSLYSDADVALPSKEYSTAALRGATMIQVRMRLDIEEGPLVAAPGGTRSAPRLACSPLRHGHRPMQSHT